jgi:hypothetical protein
MQSQHIPQMHPIGIKHMCITGTKPSTINIVLIIPNNSAIMNNRIKDSKLIIVHTKETQILHGVVIAAHNTQGSAKQTSTIEQQAHNARHACIA